MPKIELRIILERKVKIEFGVLQLMTVISLLLLLLIVNIGECRVVRHSVLRHVDKHHLSALSTWSTTAVNVGEHNLRIRTSVERDEAGEPSMIDISVEVKKNTFRGTTVT